MNPSNVSFGTLVKTAINSGMSKHVITGYLSLGFVYSFLICLCFPVAIAITLICAHNKQLNPVSPFYLFANAIEKRNSTSCDEVAAEFREKNNGEQLVEAKSDHGVGAQKSASKLTDQSQECLRREDSVNGNDNMQLVAKNNSKDPNPIPVKHGNNVGKKTNASTVPAVPQINLPAGQASVFIEGKGFYIIECGGNGDCFYRAVAYQIYGDAKKYSMVRQDLYKHILKCVGCENSSPKEIAVAVKTLKRFAGGEFKANESEIAAISAEQKPIIDEEDRLTNKANNLSRKIRNIENQIERGGKNCDALNRQLKELQQEYNLLSGEIRHLREQANAFIPKIEVEINKHLRSLPGMAGFALGDISRHSFNGDNSSIGKIAYFGLAASMLVFAYCQRKQGQWVAYDVLPFISEYYGRPTIDVCQTCNRFTIVTENGNVLAPIMSVPPYTIAGNEICFSTRTFEFWEQIAHTIGMDNDIDLLNYKKCLPEDKEVIIGTGRGWIECQCVGESGATRARDIYDAILEKWEEFLKTLLNKSKPIGVYFHGGNHWKALVSA